MSLTITCSQVDPHKGSPSAYVFLKGRPEAGNTNREDRHVVYRPRGLARENPRMSTTYTIANIDGVEDQTAWIAPIGYGLTSPSVTPPRHEIVGFFVGEELQWSEPERLDTSTSIKILHKPVQPGSWICFAQQNRPWGTQSEISNPSFGDYSLQIRSDVVVTDLTLPYRTIATISVGESGQLLPTEEKVYPFAQITAVRCNGSRKQFDNLDAGLTESVEVPFGSSYNIDNPETDELLVSVASRDFYMSQDVAPWGRTTVVVEAGGMAAYFARN